MLMARFPAARILDLFIARCAADLFLAARLRANRRWHRLPGEPLERNDTGPER